MLVMIIIVMCPITLDILQHMPRNIQGEEFNLKMICITIYIIITTIINTWSILTMLDNDSAPPSGGVDYNPNMDPDPINDMYNHPRNNNSKSSIAGSRPWMTCQFLRIVGRQFYQTSCSVCSYKELWNFEHFFRTIW